MKRENAIAPPWAAICSRISWVRRALWARASASGAADRRDSRGGVTQVRSRPPG
ncbi:hypothetical protein [Lysobacter gummosus]|uniref:hypothetical protein n=1 Tax=Lysobacter gummosus TaxID=262324 RepID=UPI0036381650